MATLREKLDKATKEIAELKVEIEKYKKVNDVNKTLKDDLSTKTRVLKSTEQKLNNVKVITEAFKRVESRTEEVEVGNYRGTPTLETQIVSSPIIEILDVILDTCK